MFSRFTKKLSALAASLIILMSVVPTSVSPAQAIGSVQTTYDFSALPAGHGLVSTQFHHDYLNTDLNVGAGGADGNGTSGGFLDGNYTLTVAPANIPAGFQVGNVPHPIPFVITPGGTAAVVISIVTAGGGGGGGGGTGSIQTTYDFSTLPAGHGLVSAQFHHDYLNTDTNTAAGGADGDGTSGGFTVGNYTLTVAPANIPAGFQVGNVPHPIPFAITSGGTAAVIISIVTAGGGGGGGGGGTGSIQTTYDFSTLPAGHGLVSAQFHHDYLNTDLNVGAGGADGNGTSGGLTVGNYTLTVAPANIPAGFQVGNVPHPIPFIITNGGTAQVTINIVTANPGSAQFTVNPTVGLTTTETGVSAQFTVALVSNPTANVSIAVTSSDITEGTVNTATLTFTPTNGTVAQVVTIVGIDDALIDGNILYTIDLAPAVSTDGNFNGQDPQNVSVTNFDNDAVGGGGAGSRLRGTPIVTFFKDDKEISSLQLQRGENSNVEVRTNDLRGGLIFLSLIDDPTLTLTNKASFTVAEQATQFPVGTLSWVADASNTGVYSFTFLADGLYTTEAILPITIVETVGAPLTAGPRFGGGGGAIPPTPKITIEERVATCEYSDNKSESVIYLCLLGIIDAPNKNGTYNGGNKANRYFGRDKITRAAFTKIMINITYEDGTIDRVKELINKNAFYAFPDVEPVAWFSQFITVAKLDDHVHGYPDLGLFVPWNDIEISEAVKILFNTARHDNEKIQQDLVDSAAAVGEDAAWFMKFAALAFKYGGYTPNLESRDPGDVYSKKLTRQKASDIIYTTIQNAGIQPKSHVSALKEELIEVQEEIKEADIDLELDPVTG
jgi:hypothetical protein